MEYYNDFLSHLSEVMTKIQELLEKVTIKHNEAAICLLETSSLYNPQILIDLAEMTSNGTRFDEYILEGEMVKDHLEKLLAQPKETTDYFKTLVEDLEKVESSLSNV
nr:uncharacterized protein LOC106683161 [Halyomorpha halys]